MASRGTRQAGLDVGFRGKVMEFGLCRTNASSCELALLRMSRIDRNRRNLRIGI